MEPPRLKRARLVAAGLVGEDTRLMTFALDGDAPLGFVGGQFVSVHTGQVAASGKPLRRAYSLFGDDAMQDRFELAVKRIEGGEVSAYVHGLAVGDEIRFTGPWGEFHPPAGARGPLLVVATDTGVTAALGLVQSARVASRLHETTFLWLRTGEGYFLPEAMVRARVPAACRDVRVAPLPPIGHPERIAHVRGLVLPLLGQTAPAHAFVAGDGAVNYALLEDLVHAGVPATRDSVESFFNLPRKTA
jgi:ferredoxin-NADP reductase